MRQNSENKKISVKKKISILLLILVLAIAGILIGAGNFLVTYAIGRGGDGGNRGEAALEVELPPDGIERTIAENNQLAQDANRIFFEKIPGESVRIEGASGLTLNAGFYENPGSHEWAITIHGYRGRHEYMGTSIRNFYEAGYQVLAPDLEGCGETEGNYIGMGWPDRLDILRWIDWIIEKDPESRIVIYGISMGAATTMMISGEDTTDHVTAFVEDCGYTSVYDIFASELALRFHLPEFPLMPVAGMAARLRAGYSFTEASALEQIKKCEKPMLFIHGTADDFIPYEMMGILYDAKPGTNKKQITVEGAGHGQAMSVLGDAYWTEVFDFLSVWQGAENE